MIVRKIGNVSSMITIHSRTPTHLSLRTGEHRGEAPHGTSGEIAATLAVLAQRHSR
jgi:hypothetical protein